MGVLKSRRPCLLLEGSLRNAYDETFAPVAKCNSIHTILGLVACYGWSLYQMDVKITYLNGVIEEVYINQSRDFEVYG
jgi:hypothetical protein